MQRKTVNPRNTLAVISLLPVPLCIYGGTDDPSTPDTDPHIGGSHISTTRGCLRASERWAEGSRLSGSGRSLVCGLGSAASDHSTVSSRPADGAQSPQPAAPPLPQNQLLSLGWTQPRSSLVLRLFCPASAVLLSWFCPGSALVVPLFFPGSAPVLPWFFPGSATVLSWFCPGSSLVLPWFFPGSALVLPWYLHCSARFLPGSAVPSAAFPLLALIGPGRAVVLTMRGMSPNCRVFI